MNFPRTFSALSMLAPETRTLRRPPHVVAPSGGHALDRRARVDSPTAHRLKPGLHAAGLRAIVLLALSLALPSTRAADANPPNKMSYQGYAVDANGQPLGKDNPLNYDIIFRIYDVPQGGTARWTEQQTVTIDKGYFSVFLGDGSQVSNDARPLLSTVFAGADASDRFIGITVKKQGSQDMEILPRLRLLPAPYSFLAAKANAVANASGANVINTSGERVGIGTTGPDRTLDVEGDVTINDKTIYLRGGVNADHGVGWYGTNKTFATVAVDGPVVFGWNGGILGTTQAGQKAVLYWNSSGNVGIGTTTPGFPLSFADSLGDKISFSGQSGNSYGIGVQPSLLQIHTDTQNSDIAFGYGRSGAMAETMRIKGNGKVGIGTTSPDRTLDVRGDVTINDKTIYLRGGSDTNHGVGWYGTGKQFATVAVDGPVVFGNAGGALATTQNGGKTVLSWNSSGNVGIGIPNPAAPLHVKKRDTSVPAGTRKGGKDTSYGVYLGGNGGVLWPDGTSNGAGDNETIASGALSAVFDGDIIASSHIWVGNALEFSDARAKNLLGTSDSVLDLRLLRNIQVRDFTWIDRTVDNHRPQKKLVAQEVEQVFPQAVQRVPHPTAIPNVYQVAERIEFRPEQNELRLTTGKPHEFKVGDSVGLHTDDAPLTNVKVTAVRGEREFSVSYDHAPKSVFVYGKYVTDYRSVDYDAIAMLNVSATQELARQVDALKQSQTRIAELERTAAKVTQLEQKAARVDSLEREVAELKKLVAGLAQGQMAPTPSSRNIAAAASR